ncbi:MAG TPA: phosphatase PAP2 family protein [Actinomycetales bacterium]|nr:phosphatase PAP2 family protein [Actinomycetales bacterium]
MTSVRHLDDRLMLAVNEFARSTPFLHAGVVGYATYGVVLFGALLVAGLVYARHRRSDLLAAAGWAGVATLLAVALNQPLGRHVAEARPYTTHPGLLRLVSPTADFSFPSDHCVMAGAVTLGLLLVSRRLGLVALVLALLMAFARVYVAAHYPWDAAAGLVLGGGVCGLGWLLLRRPLTALTEWLRSRPGVRLAFAQTVSAP